MYTIIVNKQYQWALYIFNLNLWWLIWKEVSVSFFLEDFYRIMENMVVVWHFVGNVDTGLLLYLYMGDMLTVFIVLPVSWLAVPVS